MKKILLLFSICLIPMLGYAQTDENGKERVYIDYFSRPGTISNILAEALRNKVIEGIQKMDRVELIDVDSNEALKTEAKRRQEASAMGDAVCRSEVMTTLGAQYLIQGNITSMQGVKKTDSKGKTYYQGSVSYTLKIVDPSNGTLKGTQTFTHEGLTGNIGDTPDEAIIKTWNQERGTKRPEIYRLHRDGYCRRTVIERSRTLECERSIERNTFFMYREQRR